ncbi:DUF4159 domain-containing protein [Candidatus Latescibacterota bacterium]
MRHFCSETMKVSQVVLITALMAFATVQTLAAQPPGSGSDPTDSKASITFDLANKKSISGHVYIAHATGSRMKTPRNVGGGLINLKEAMTKYTKIDTKVDRQIRLSSREILKLPYVYIAFEGGFDLTEPERSNLKAYLENGGFIMLEQFAMAKEQTSSGSAFSRMISKVLGSKARVSPLRNNHNIYHSFFDFTDGPPQGGEAITHVVGSTYTIVPGNPVATRIDSEVSGKKVDYIEGINMNGRLVGICSSKRYLAKWQERGNNDPQLKFGVNTIVFALTQKGGIARR